MYTVENSIVHFHKSQNLTNSEADLCFLIYPGRVDESTIRQLSKAK